MTGMDHITSYEVKRLKASVLSAFDTVLQKVLCHFWFCLFRLLLVFVDIYGNFMFLDILILCT
jgi:hypothetical protein